MTLYHATFVRHVCVILIAQGSRVQGPAAVPSFCAVTAHVSASCYSATNTYQHIQLLPVLFLLLCITHPIHTSFLVQHIDTFSSVTYTFRILINPPYQFTFPGPSITIAPPKRLAVIDNDTVMTFYIALMNCAFSDLEERLQRITLTGVQLMRVGQCVSQEGHDASCSQNGVGRCWSRW